MGLSRRQFTKEFKLAAVRRLEMGASACPVRMTVEPNGPPLSSRVSIFEQKRHAKKALDLPSVRSQCEPMVEFNQGNATA
jgi:hypothetical protein